MGGAFCISLLCWLMYLSTMSYECVRQRGLFDCGTACLTALLRYHGLAVSAKHPNFRIKGFGVSFYELVSFTTTFGFESLIYKTTDLKSLSYPCIVSVKFLGFRHYWLVYESRGDVLIVMDPALGKLSFIRKKIFSTLWTGVFMCIRPKVVST